MRDFEALRSEILTAVTAQQAELLAEYAHGQTVLEVGAHFGYSTVVLAKYAKKLVSVDYHRMDGDHTILGGAFKTYLANLDRFNVINDVIMMIGSSHEVLPLLAKNSFDFIFVDGDHDEEAVTLDIEFCVPLLTSDGVIAFHDYDVPHLGVQNAVNRYFAETQVDNIFGLGVVRP